MVNRPINNAEVLSLLVKANYLTRFVPQLATVVQPIRELTKENVEWCWEKEQEDAFTELKHRITDSPTIEYFKTNKPATLIVGYSNSRE